MPSPRPKKISQFKPLFTRLAQTSHYQVVFGGLSIELKKYLNSRGISNLFIGDDVGLLCNSASLPGSSFATADIIGNYTGVVEKMAHTRTFTQIDLEFYVDHRYRSLKFLEHWMEYISSGSQDSPYADGYNFRMKYPNSYKTNATKIIKFDRDYKSYIEYTFYGLFPLTLNSTPVSYDSSTILKASASFNFDRYICGKTTSLSVAQNTSNNLTSRGGSPTLVPISAGAAGASGVRYRPASISTAEAIVSGRIYKSRTDFLNSESN